MAFSTTTPSLRHFLEDLVSVREKHGFSRSAFQRVTKINMTLIEQFEDNALVGHPLFNDVYQRAILRSYAAVARIEEGLLVRGFEAALAGTYRRELAVTYLGMEAPAMPDPPVLPDDVQPNAAHASEPHPPARTMAPLLASLHTFAARLRGRGLPLRLGPAWKHWGAVAVAIALGLALLYPMLSSDQPADPLPSPAQAEAPISLRGDTFITPQPAATDPTPTRAPDADVVLRDTLALVVIAERGKLDPFRIQVDRDLRRPYWLDAGDSLAFSFTERVALEDKLADMRLFLEGHPYPLAVEDTSARLIINRDSVRYFLADRLLASRE
jgi:hypothetical protein